MNKLNCDVLIIGGGGAALYAALRVHHHNPKLKVVVASKGLFGKSGCTRMVQGGYNVVLDVQDSFEAHFNDTLVGGGMINNQDLAWLLVTEAPERIYELENRFGCYFDRNDDGTIHQRALAGQSFNRTVHRADLTGIELMSRLSEQVLVRDITVLNEVRGLDLLKDSSGKSVCGALLFDLYRGDFIEVNARCTLLSTGGSAPLYSITAASLEKSGDGMAMAYRAGAEFVDMEMMQFHPTGLIAGDSVMTGTVLEEGLRGAGGHLLNVEGERYMQRYDPEKMERSTRDRVSRSGFLEISAGRGTPERGVFLDVRHLGKDFLLKSSPGMYERCLSVGYDMANQPVQVTPTAHFQMGGVKIDTNILSNIDGLFVAGEDAGGVHGANRLGGNGVAESIVYGGLAGDQLAKYASESDFRESDKGQVQVLVDRYGAVKKGNGNPFQLKDRLRKSAWNNLGIVRDAESLEQASRDLQEIAIEIEELPRDKDRAGNLGYAECLDLENLLAVARMICVSAGVRKESRGSHYRTDYPDTSSDGLYNIFLERGEQDDDVRSRVEPVTFSRRKPEEILGEVLIPGAQTTMESRTET